ncbi:MAG: indole-3-glycerol-phosphate synthase [Gracilibacteraceae bacterium]|jgi:indole-3-glycerol phosphate synthase|nr:indole-3-glycerol-phosphate synthase [Gracilibacteraceae bacterium]
MTAAKTEKEEGLLTAVRARRQAGFIPVIPDFKVRSPKEGDLTRGRAAGRTALEFKALGAPALSVVTENASFGGSLRLLEETAAAGLPVLRKDFIREREDLRQSKEAGAAAVLLICALLAPPALAELFAAARELGLTALVETHTEDELALAARLGARLIGINNRDIRRLETDDGAVARTKRLAPLAPPGALLVSESGLQTPADVRAAAQAGADAALVGSALWLAADMGALYDAMQRAMPAEPAARAEGAGRAEPAERA